MSTFSFLAAFLKVDSNRKTGHENMN